MESTKYPSQMTEVELIDAVFAGGIMDYLGYDGQIEREASMIKTLLEELQRKIKDPSRDASIAAQTRADKIRDAFEAGYSRGHNDTVESCVVDMRQAADEYLAITQGQDDPRDAWIKKALPLLADAKCGIDNAFGNGTKIATQIDAIIKEATE